MNGFGDSPSSRLYSFCFVSQHSPTQLDNEEVTSLENENNLLENKQKELKGTIQDLLESKEAFLKAYENSTYEMKRAISDRDRETDVLPEKLKAHLLLFGSISKEVSSINKRMDDASHTLRQKEDAVAGLKRKMDDVSTFEKPFVDTKCSWTLANVEKSEYNTLIQSFERSSSINQTDEYRLI